MTQLENKILANDIHLITLIGRLDIPGAGTIETAFAAKTAITKAKIIVDLSQVDFMSSIGIRLLLTNAKAQDRRGGKMVLLNPQPLVKETLLTVGVDKLIPLYADFDAAVQDLNATVTS